MSDVEFFVSPSKLGHYFYHNCERQLQEAAQVGTKTEESPPDPNLVLEMLQDSGYRWEEKVVSQHLEGRVKVAPGEAALRDRHFTVDQTPQQLLDLNEGEWLYQPTLDPGNALHRRFGLDHNLVAFPRCRPDLLHLHQGRLMIVDVKASESLKAGHRVQVAFYALILEALLKDLNAHYEVNLEEGAIWLYETPEPQTFDLGPSLAVLREFIRHDLQPLLRKPPKQTFWHLTPRCEWCDLFQRCKTQALTERDVSLLPGLSHGSKLYLAQQLGVSSLNQLEPFVSKGDSDKHFRNCGSLAGRARRLRKLIHALDQQTVQNHGGATSRLPVTETVKLAITVQKEPVSGQIYAAGFVAQQDGQPQTQVLSVAEHPGDCNQVRIEFLESLFQTLYALHNENTQRPWQDQKTLQVYCFDSFEKELFEALLFQHLNDPAHSRQATQLMLYFQNEEVAEAKAHPTQEVPHPIVPLLNVVQELLALPQPIALTITSTLRHLATDKPYAHNERFHYQINPALRAGPILSIWESADGRGLGPLQRELRRRMQGTLDLLYAVREQVKERLFAWPRRFLFPGFQRFNDPKLSRVAFVVRYESLLAAMQTREARARPYLERVTDGTTINLQKIGEHQWRVLSHLPSSQFDPRGGFPTFLASLPGSDGDRAQMSFDDYKERRQYNASKPPVWTVGISEVNVDENTNLLSTLSLKQRDSAFQALPIGQKLHLHPRFTDFLSHRQIECLQAWDQRPHSLLSSLLAHPSGLPPLPQPGPPLQNSSLTPSQQRALDHLREWPLTLVWGPPGTGKTHFISQAVSQFLHGHDTFSVIITAFTHAAVENVLRKLSTLALPCTLAKLGELKSEHAHLDTLEPKNARTLTGPFVVGSTVYKVVQALQSGMPQADLLIVDEGSQMKWGEFAMALSALKPGGRLLLAGDDLQLPPIINGAYPEDPEGLVGLEDSVFAYLRSRDSATHPYTCQLTESWRMNTTLSQFAAETLYGRSYGPATQKIANQRLPYAPTGHPLDPLLDPAYPLVVAILENVQAAQENLLEAHLVSDLSTLLRAQFQSDDQEFWSEHLFIVSPHHLQIRAIREALASQREWTSPPFVDTVDKMQGQEAEAVIVSYGVSDRETALQEAEFLYSLNRLNVSVTRAKSKCIAFLPRPLLTPSFELLSNEKAARGLGHMLALLQYCQTHGHALELEVGAKLTVWRAKFTTEERPEI